MSLGGISSFLHWSLVQQRINAIICAIICATPYGFISATGIFILITFSCKKAYPVQSSSSDLPFIPNVNINIGNRTLE